MDKFQVAHDVLLKLIETDERGFDPEGIAGYAWEIADAMQAEADKRKEKGMPDVLKSHEHNWENVTVMGDNVAKFVCADCGAVKHDVLEWQLDWSVAPSWANFAAIQKDLHVLWCESKPEISKHGDWFVCGGRSVHRDVVSNYKGDWRNSLRKRPQ